ncbi:MAG: SCO family protein [Xanthomonadaceae bacterium]|nr:SCO family protein [Xanthomonadaceae bacterium]
MSGGYFCDRCRSCAALLGLAALMLLAGCADDRWHGKDISGLMPELEFELIDENGQAVTEQMTGSQRQLRQITRRYRITYGYEEPDAEGHYEVSHSSAIFVFDRQHKSRLMLLDSLSVEQMRQDLERLLVATAGS